MLETIQHTAVKPTANTPLTQFVKGFALTLALIAGVAAASRPVAAETPAEFISILGTDVLHEMRSSASSDQ
jgi:hypothetical protein